MVTKTTGLTILLIEEDQELSYILSQQLEDDGYGVLCTGDGLEGLRMVEQRQPDLVLLDVDMSCMDGWDICSEIPYLSDALIMIISFRTTELDTVCGLELGADDYVAKPINYLELLARIRAVLRRGGRSLTKRPMVVIDDRLSVDPTRHGILIDGQSVGLSVIEYKLLACFLDHVGHTLSSRSLLIQVWGWEYAENTNRVKNYIHILRKKIEKDPAHPRYILTRRGVGYRFKVP